MTGTKAMWRLELGDRGILAPGRWLWLRVSAWAALLFGITLGGFIAAVELADRLNLSRGFAYLFSAAFPVVTTIFYALLVYRGER